MIWLTSRFVFFVPFTGSEVGIRDMVTFLNSEMRYLGISFVERDYS